MSNLAVLPGTPAPAPAAWEQYRARLATYAKVNYDYQDQRVYTPATGGRLDDYATDLPAEAPGPPASAGSFAAAQDVLRRYAFPLPNLITGYFDPQQPIIVLWARFLVFNFCFGVQVVDVINEAVRPEPDGPTGSEPERVWGYGYHTLGRYFEKGQINFSIYKNLTTGAAQFYIHAVSQKRYIRNPFY